MVFSLDSFECVLLKAQRQLRYLKAHYPIQVPLIRDGLLEVNKKLYLQQKVF